MPIKVKYGGDISALAQLALAAGAADIPQSRAPAIGRGGGGGGGRRSQPRAEGISEADLAILEEDAAESAFERDMELQQQEQQSQMDQFEWKLDITTKKKQNEARRSLAYLDSPEGRERFNEREREIIGQQAMQEILRPSKTPYLKEPDVLNDGLPPEQQNGALFEHESGAWGSYKIDRSSGRRFFDPSVQYKDTPAGITQAAQIKRGETRTALAAKLFGQPVPVLDASGEDTGATKPRSAEDAWRAAYDFYPTEQMQQEQAAPTISAEEIDTRQQQIEAFKAEEIAREEALRNPRELIGWARNVAGPLTEAERKMPFPVGVARSFMREVRRRKKAGRQIPSAMSPAIREALAIIEQAKSNAKD